MYTVKIILNIFILHDVVSFTNSDLKLCMIQMMRNHSDSQQSTFVNKIPISHVA